MTLECINPPDLPIPQMYTQVVVARATKLIFVSGQESEDLHGKLVGRGDFAVQARLVFANLRRALAAAGALPKQVAKITIYVVDYQRDQHLPIIEEAQVTLFGNHKPANVVMGVAALMEQAKTTGRNRYVYASTIATATNHQRDPSPWR